MFGLTVFVTGSLLPSLLLAYDSVKFEFLSSYLGQSDPYAIPTYQIPTVLASEAGSVSANDFESIVRRGIPTVFRSAGAKWKSLRNLSCEDFATRWPDAVMRAEYTGAAGEVFLQLKDKDIWASSTRPPLDVYVPEVECEKDVHAKISRPIFAPYVLHVKDRVRQSIKKEINSMYPGFPWKTSALLDAHIRDSMEFWFQQVGAGTFAHNDAYCHSVFSVQLRGSKKWRLMLTPAVNQLSRDVFDEFDSGIYDSVHQWEPDFEVILHEGDGILFPPGYMHETRTVSGPSNSTDDTCGTSVTFNMPLPFPTKLVRTFLPRFSVSRELHQCMHRWESFVTLSSSRVPWSAPTGPPAQEEDLLASIMDRVDADKNGVIELEELKQYLMHSDDANVAVFKTKKSMDLGDMFLAFAKDRTISADMTNEAMHIRAIDTLNMWDLNEDGFATKDEIFEVLQYFHYYKYRQGIVDKAVAFDNSDGTFTPYPIGSEPFIAGMELAQYTLDRNCISPPVLSPEKHPKLTAELVSSMPCHSIKSPNSEL